jgi:hypothetical protein
VQALNVARASHAAAASAALMAPVVAAAVLAWVVELATVAMAGPTAARPATLTAA